MTVRCTSEPVSWLRLERHHRGELPVPEGLEIDGHLAACPACAACLATIRDDEAVPLPPLRLAAAARRPVSRAGRWAAAMGALAAVGAVVLALHTGPEDGGVVARSSRVYAKGGALSFSLVREDGQRIDGDAGGYRDGERFRALVTCAPGAATYFDVVVYDEGGAAFPLAPADAFACGNDVPLPGAFRLTGRGDEEVCLVWSESGAVDRAVVGLGPGPLERRLCKRLTSR